MVKLNKVMKAPERLYLRKRNKLPLEVVRDEWYETDPKSPFGSVEYTRTDAFIEKACKFIKDNGSHYIDIVNGQLVLKKGIINDFRKYIEGE